MLDSSLKQSLQSVLPTDQILTARVQTVAYQLDAGMERHIPEGVALPESTADVQKLVNWAVQHRVPLTARGAGTSYTGGSIASQNGIVISFARMKNILEVDEISRQVTVQPGVVNHKLQERLQAFNLVYPPDPASYTVCTLGGNIAENAGGPHCLKYGVTSNYVLGLEMVLSNGQVVVSGGKALDPPEYDFTSLVTGSEGTLGLVTSAILLLRRPFQGVQALTASFASLAQAGEAVSAIIAAGLMPATIELMDKEMIGIVEDYLQAGFPRQAGAMLIIDVDGYPESLDTQLAQIAAILEQYQPLEIKLAHSAEERDVVWRGRRSAAGAISRTSPNELLVDVSVPRSRLAEVIQAINAIGHDHQFRVGFLAHAGDGNLHPNILCDFSKPGEQERALRAAEEILRFCAGIGGSITGEHGVGLEKRNFLSSMYAPAEIDAMLEVKQVFDPINILNPGKIFPPTHQPASPVPEADLPLPGDFFQPTSPSEAAEGMRALQSAKKAAYIVGGQTHWRGDTPAGTRFSSSGLNRILKLSPDDLFVTAEAGISLVELQIALREKGFWTPLAFSHPESTLGGAIASNFNSPWRNLYGGVRDQLLATQIILADGRLLRFGRPLVKDVAGYNMSKLMVGSYGTLGLIVEATLKLYPLPRARSSLVVSPANLQQGLSWGYEALRLGVACAGVVLVSDGDGVIRLVYTSEGHPQDVAAEMRLVRQALAGKGASEIIETTETSATRQWEQLFAASDLVVRAATVPAKLNHLLELIPSSGQAFVMDVANGLLALSCPPVEASDTLRSLRQAAEPDGYAVVAAGARGLISQINAWGAPRSTCTLMQQLKLRWDPADILNRGEFISPLYPRHQ